MITSLTEEAEAISWYEQHMSVEKDKDAKAIMANAQKEEFKHFGMNLEFLLRKMKDWRRASGNSFQRGRHRQARRGGRKESRLGLSRCVRGIHHPGQPVSAVSAGSVGGRTHSGARRQDRMQKKAEFCSSTEYPHHFRFPVRFGAGGLAGKGL
jgi:hypothetical protein